MKAIFLEMLNMSIVASWLILAVIIIRFLFKKSPKWIRGIMWSMVAVRLVLPISFESVFSLLPNAQTFDGTSGSSVSYISSADYQTEKTRTDALEIISFLWIIGTVVMLGYMLFSYIRLRKMVAEGVKLRDNIWICDHIRSPFVVGFFRPQIYLLSSIAEKETEYVIAHEQAHLKRLDNIWKPLGFVLLSFYWFNPLCWIAYWLFNKDIELACDEKVIKTLDSKGKKAYSATLLTCSSNHHMVSACPLAFAENDVKHRIKSVLSYKKPTIYAVTLTVVACLTVAVLFMTNPVSATENKKAENIRKPKSNISATEIETVEKKKDTEPETEKVKKKKKETEPTDNATEETVKPTETTTSTQQTQAETNETVPAETYSDNGFDDNMVEIEEFEIDFEKVPTSMYDGINGDIGGGGLSTSMGAEYSKSPYDTFKNIDEQVIAWDFSPSNSTP